LIGKNKSFPIQKIHLIS